MRISAGQRRQKRISRGGFTLVEVLLVLAIIGVIMAIGVPMLLGRQKQAMIQATHANIQNLDAVLKQYAMDHDGEYPNSNVGLEILLQNPGSDPKWHGPYMSKMPADAWGNPLQYAYPGQHQQVQGVPDIWSHGPDKIPNTEDDINNWTPH